MKHCITSLLFALLLSSAASAQPSSSAPNNQLLDLSWMKMNFTSTAFMTGISFASKDTVFDYASSTGSSQEYRSVDGGFTWSPFATPHSNYAKFLNPMDGYTFGTTGNDSWTSATTDGGMTWGPEINDSLGGFSALSVLRSKDTAFVASQASILRTIDGGQSWHRMNAPVVTAIYSFAFADSKHAIAVGQHLDNGGCLSLVSSDGGLNWIQTVLGAFQDQIGVTYCGIDTAISVGNEIYRTTNGGQTWVNIVAPGIFDSWSSIASSHNNVVLVGNSGVIAYSSDAGATWARQTSGTNQDLHSVAMYGDTVAMCDGQSGTILRATGITSAVATLSPATPAPVEVYPDPAKDQVQLRLNLSSNEPFTVGIYNAGGSLLLSTTPKGFAKTQILKFETASLPSGTYFYHVKGQHQDLSGPFEIVR